MTILLACFSFLTAAASTADSVRIDPLPAENAIGYSCTINGLYAPLDVVYAIDEETIESRKVNPARKTVAVVTQKERDGRRKIVISGQASGFNYNLASYQVPLFYLNERIVSKTFFDAERNGFWMQIDAKTRNAVHLLTPQFFTDSIGRAKLYVVDGVATSPAEVARLNVTDFARLDLIPAEEAKTAYGKLGKNGAVVIKMRSRTTAPSATGAAPAGKKVKRPLHLDQFPAGALYALNGRLLTAEEMQRYDADEVETMSLIDSAAAQAIYGQRGKNGVVVVALKKKAP